MPVSKANSGSSGVVPAVIYGAKSTEDKHGSIPTQISDCREGIEQEGGRFLYADPLSDEGYSAFHGNRGPGLAEAKRLAIEAATKHGQAELWVQHSDRLARGDGLNADHLGEVFFEMRRHGVRLRSVQDDSNMEDVIRAVLIGERNTEDSRRKSEAVKSGMRRRAERGKRQGGPRPFGYQHEIIGVDPATKKPITRVVQVPHEAAVVLRIFTEVANGRPQSTIARALNDEGINTVNGASWKQTRISQMTRNPIYLGKLKTKHGVFEGEHEPVVTLELWERVQQLREGRGPSQGRGRRPKNNTHLLTNGLLRCGLCGAAMVPRSEKTREVYRCSGRHQGNTNCQMKPVLRAMVDGAVVEYFFSDAFDLEATRRQITEATGREQEEIDALLAEAERQALGVQAHRERSERDYRSGDLPAHLYAEERDELSTREASTQAEVTRLRQRSREVAGGLLPDAEHDLLEYLSNIQKAASGEITTAGGTDAIRAALIRLFDRLDLFPADMCRRLPQGGDQPVDRLHAAEYIIEPYVRPGIVVGWHVEDDGIDQWHMPVLAKTPLPAGETKSSSAR